MADSRAEAGNIQKELKTSYSAKSREVLKKNKNTPTILRYVKGLKKPTGKKKKKPTEKASHDQNWNNLKNKIK